MWKDLKNKMKRWLEPEENTDQEMQPTKQESHEINAKTKMTYRYPKQGEFRFPVIPDQHGNNNEEQGTYPRPRRKKIVTEETPETSPPQRRKNREKPEAKELPETSAIPFTPTDVPSPIYGYQQRQLTKGVENLEYAVEEQKQAKPEFFTDSDDEKQWQALRKRMRAHVNVQEFEKEEEMDVKDWAEGESEHQDIQAEEAAVEESTLTFAENSTKDDFEIEEYSSIETEKEEYDHSYEEKEEEQKEEEWEGLAFEDEMEFNESMEVIDEQLDKDEGNSVDLSTEENDSETTVDSDLEEEPTLPEHEVNAQEVEVNQQEQVEKNKVEEDSPHASEELKKNTSKKRSVPFNVLMTPRDKRTRDQSKLHQGKQMEEKEEKKNHQKNREEKRLRVRRE